MKKYTKFLCIALTVICVLVLTSCQGTTNNTENIQGDKPYIAVIAKGFQHQFWQTVKKGAQMAADDYGVQITFQGTETEAQIDKQTEMLDAALSKNPVAVCIAALDSKAVLGSLEKAHEKGIPIVGFDSGVDSDIVTATAATDNKAAAALAADKLAEAIGGKGEIGMIVQDQTSMTGRDRRDGFKERIEEKYPDIKIVDIQYGEGDHTKSADAAKAIISANPNIAGMYGANEGSAIGVVLALSELNKTGKIQAVGFDSGKRQIDAVKNGEMYGAVTQDPIQIGYKAVEAAYKAYKGEKVEKNIDTGFKWYDKSNVEKEEIKQLLYD